MPKNKVILTVPAEVCGAVEIGSKVDVSCIGTVVGKSVNDALCKIDIEPDELDIASGDDDSDAWEAADRGISVAKMRMFRRQHEKFLKNS